MTKPRLKKSVDVRRRSSTSTDSRSSVRKAGCFIAAVLLLFTPHALAQRPAEAGGGAPRNSVPDHLRAAPDKNQRPSAVFTLENLTTPDAEDHESTFDSLRALAQERNWKDLAETAEGLLAASDDRRLHYWLGIAQLQLSDFVHAAIALRAAERLGMKAAALHKALGIAYYGLRQHALFREQMEKAIEADPRDGEPYHYLGRYHELDLNDFSTALSYFDQALARNPEDVKSHHFRAVCFEMLDRSEEAEQAYRTTIDMVDQQGKPYSWPFERLAILLLGRDPKLALPFGQRAVGLEPSRVENRLLLAKIYENINRAEDALPQLEEAARLKPNSRSIRYVLFRIYRKLGRKDDAARELAMHEKLKAAYGTSQQ